MNNAELLRLNSCTENHGWKYWGPYLSERQWGTVREDYSADGSAWESTNHEMARSKAYRWGEEGLMGISDSKQNICLALSLWNGKDRILKERLFGLSGNQGNHGEDVKELYYYLDSTPTHSYMKALYKYPIVEYPYTQIIEENNKRGRNSPEFELEDTGIFEQNKYFDVFFELAKNEEQDLLVKYTIYNRSNEDSELSVLPTLWFRNEWSTNEISEKPDMLLVEENRVDLYHVISGKYHLYFDGNPEVLFTENDTNFKKVYNVESESKYFKDGINEYIVNGDKKAVNPAKKGTKSAFNYKTKVLANKSVEIKLRLTNFVMENPFGEFDNIYNTRKDEADEYYKYLQVDVPNEDLRNIQRQAYAGMLWSKQFYYFNINKWIKGDEGMPKPPQNRANERNASWKHFNASNIISMPDKWEYPWFAAWDLAFHTIPLCRLDPLFAKRQLEILLREYYMHPNGQIPAYEWNFSDVNPPVHAWATWRVYEIDKLRNNGVGDVSFLEKIFHKLLLNFTWWVNQKDSEGNNIFEGGFLGLDNIGVFDRSQPLPTGGSLEQADGTSWMAMFCLNMLRISVEISLHDPVYQDMASKFLEHFLHIAGALNEMGQGASLWDDEDDFYYDLLHMPNGYSFPLKIRSMVGIIPLFAVETIDQETLDKLPIFKRRVGWILENKPELAELISRWHEKGRKNTSILSLTRGYRMSNVLKRVLDKDEFLSDYGVRALSKFHDMHPYEFDYNGKKYTVNYTPGESNTSLFGGNSNWRGPIWFPLNYLLIESLMKFYNYYGDDFKLEYPTGSGKLFNLKDIADKLGERLIKLFTKTDGKRAIFGNNKLFQNNEHFTDNLLFHEYFHGDTGKGLGASHQTGWTGLIADLIHECSIIQSPEEI
jgi:hypothetical protein